MAEELFFRGALLSGMRARLSSSRILILQALLFGLAHFSIYRFLPTACVGFLCAVVALRTASLWPAVILHAGHNARAVLIGTGEGWAWLGDPRLGLWAAIGLCLLVLPARGAREARGGAAFPGSPRAASRPSTTA